jgi:cytoskeletal protein CcmA (bactofilin family)
MFNRKLKCDSFSSLVGEGTIVDGTIVFVGILKVQGSVQGDVKRQTTSEKECLIVDASGLIVADEVNTYDAIISGTIRCKKLWVENIFRVAHSAVIVADEIYYRSLEIEPGANIQGQLKNLDQVSEGERT